MTERLCGLGIRDATLGYGGGEPVVEDLSLTIPSGRFTALLGPNGCGKSTILHGLAGLHKPQRGEVVLDGKSIRALGTKAVARRVGLLAQTASVPDGLTVGELVRQGRYPHRPVFGAWTGADEDAVESALRLTSMTGYRDRPVDSLSGGQRQRAWIAMTLAQQSDILLLDEPTTYLDLAHQIDVLGLMRRLVDQEGATVVAVLHDLVQAARYADHLVLIRGGQIVAQGAPVSVLTPENVKEVFGVDVVILSDPDSAAPICLPRCNGAATSNPQA